MYKRLQSYKYFCLFNVNLDKHQPHIWSD